MDSIIDHFVCQWMITDNPYHLFIPDTHLILSELKFFINIVREYLFMEFDILSV